VDAVSDILTVTDDLIQPTPDVGSDQVRAFVSGIMAIDGRMISLISLDRGLPAPDSEAA
jgi:purine-binding chemotaxis protein CheW